MHVLSSSDHLGCDEQSIKVQQAQFRGSFFLFYRSAVQVHGLPLHLLTWLDTRYKGRLDNAIQQPRSSHDQSTIV